MPRPCFCFWLLLFHYPYSNGQMCPDEKEVGGIVPLRALPLQVRDLLQEKGLHGYAEPPVTLKTH